MYRQPLSELRKESDKMDVINEKKELKTLQNGLYQEISSQYTNTDAQKQKHP
jgi:hypothetical protein